MAEPAGRRVLRGIAWDHERGRAPLHAATERFADMHPDVQMTWVARSLRDFEEAGLADLAEHFDLMTIDHPLIGDASAEGALAPLDDLMPHDALTDILSEAVGRSGHSYVWDGRTWALPIDAATQVAAFRPDLLEAAGVPLVPSTWDDMLALADHLPPGAIAIAANPTHLLCTWLSLCNGIAGNAGQQPDGRPSWWRDTGLERAVATEALNVLYRLLDVVHDDSRTMDPIALLDRMSTGRHLAYAPFVYGYVTYALPGRKQHLLTFGDAPRSEGRPLGTVLGGVGLAVSAHCAEPELAAQFITLVAGSDFQRGEYAKSGGQPANRHAWTDPALNARTGNFYRSTLTTTDNAMMRPRQAGYPEFQRSAGQALHTMTSTREHPEKIVSRINDLWQLSAEATH